MKNKIILISGLIVAFSASAQTNEIYRYKDKAGSLIYTDKMPYDKVGDVGILSKKTGVIKNLTELEAAKNAQQLTDADRAEIEAKKIKEAEQLKKDQYLLNSYSSIKDIDSIKKYELDQIDRVIQNDINIIAVQKEREESLSKAMKEDPKLKSKYEKEYARVVQQIEQSKTSLNKNKETYAEREKKYNDEKERLSAVLNSLKKENVSQPKTEVK